MNNKYYVDKMIDQIIYWKSKRECKGHQMPLNIYGDINEFNK